MRYQQFSTCSQKDFISNSFTSIIIPKGVTSVGKNAFYYCQNLENVTIYSINTSVTVEGIRSKNVYNVSKNAEEGAVVNGNNTVLENDTYTFTVTVDRQYDATNMVVKVYLLHI